MTLPNFIAGLSLLANHFEDRNACRIRAERGQFYVSATERPLSQDDFRRMGELGWFQDVDNTDIYRTAEGWVCHV